MWELSCDMTSERRGGIGGRKMGKLTSDILTMEALNSAWEL